MGLGETIVFYLMIGGTVALAVALADRRKSVGQLLGLALSAIVFWPLYLPVLLSRRGDAPAAAAPEAASADRMTIAIGQVEQELNAALVSLDGWAEQALASEASRLEELRLALSAQATRIRDLDQLLDTMHEGAEPEGSSAAADDIARGGAGSRCHKSRQARDQNLARLREIRERAHGDLMATLAWIRELVSMIHLAKFTGAPASRAEELVAQIAAAVEGVSTVADYDESETRVFCSQRAVCAPQSSVAPLGANQLT